MNRKHSPFRLPLLLGRIAVAILCLALVIALAHPEDIARQLQTLSVTALLASVGLHALIIAALAWRWQLALRVMDLAPPFSEAVRLTFLSTLLNLLLPGAVGGDIGRVWLGRRHGVALGPGTAAALFERAVGLATLAALAALPVLVMPGLVSGRIGWLMVLPAAGIAGGMAALRWVRPRLAAGGLIAQIRAGLQAMLGHGWVLGGVVTISVASHITSAAIAAVIAGGMGLDLPFLTAVLLFPAVILATLLPVSIGGWGVRELAAIPLLQLAGIGADAAAALALAFGLTQLLAAVLGTVLLFLRVSRKRPAE